MTQIVYVANYEHRHGNDICVFATEELAETWRREIAKDYWHDVFEVEGYPDNAEDAADVYWEAVSGEWFNVHKCFVRT